MTVAESGPVKRVPLPEAIERGLAEATTRLASQMNCEVKSATTHRTTLVAGWNESRETRRDCAWYLVGQRAAAVSAALQIRADFADTPADRLEVLRNVERIVGSTVNPLTAQQKTDERNPWMAENLWHLCFFLADRIPAIHGAGKVIALSPPHASAKDHGPDLVALYKSGAHFGMTVVESKAYANDPNSAVSHAAKYFREIDAGQHDLLLRQTWQYLRIALPTDVQDKITASLWKSNRTYVPNPHYDASKDIDWSRARPVFKDLKVSANQIIVMPHIISDFENFFDAVADDMREIAKLLSDV